MHALRKTICLGGWQHWLWALVLLPTCRSTPRDRQGMLTGHFHKGAGTPVVARRPFFLAPPQPHAVPARGSRRKRARPCRVPRRLRGPPGQGPGVGGFRRADRPAAGAESLAGKKIWFDGRICRPPARLHCRAGLAADDRSQARLTTGRARGNRPELSPTRMRCCGGGRP